MISFFNRWLPLALVVLAALWLRVHDLARRPMHADEANQAEKVGELLETGRYEFNAHDHHGPTLYYSAVPIAWLRGQRTLAALDETTVRLVPAIAGTISVLLLAVFVGGALCPNSTVARESGHKAPPTTVCWPAVAAAAFLAVSPPAVYYSRYFVQETLLVTFTLAALVCAQRWWRTGGMGWAIGTGVCSGLMLATKESAPLFMIAAIVAVFVAPASAGISPEPAEAGATNSGGRFRMGRDVALATSAAIATATLFYSSFGTHPAGVSDALTAIGHGLARATGKSGHEKPWWYYLQLFTWQRSGGLVWEQLAFSALALVGAGIAGRSLLVRSTSSGPRARRGAGDDLKRNERNAPAAKSPASRLLPRACIYTLLIAVALSLPPYKTPWHAVQLVPGMALLAAGALAAVPSGWFAAAVGAVVLGAMCFQTNRVVFAYPTDARNPYAYVHSSPDVLKFRTLVEAALTRAPQEPVRVISEEYWPLPWYLRGLPRVGYWSTPPDACDGALVIASTTQAVGVRERLRGKYRESYLGLRPGFMLVVFTPLP